MPLRRLITLLMTFLLVTCLGFVYSAGDAPREIESIRPVEGLITAPRTPALQWFLRKMGKRGSVLKKCAQNDACAMLQIQPGTTDFWMEEICSCGDGVPACSLEWDDQSMENSITYSDTQLKLCRPAKTFPTCLQQQVAVTSTMETSIAHPMIKQAASIFCNCPKSTHEYKLVDTGMVDEGDRTVVSAHFGCVPIEHCRSLQPCKILAILPTADSLVHQNCECPSPKKCPRESRPTGIIPAVLDENTYYPFFCQ